MNNKSRRIGIDARFYGPIGKGLGRYTQEIVDNVISIDKDSEYIIFLRKENFKELITNNPRVKKVLADVKWYTFLEQILMPYYIFRERVDFMHFPHFNVPLLCPKKFIVTIHDLILIKYPTPRATTLGPMLYKIKNWAYRIVIYNALKRARKVIAVSEFTKKEIVETFKISKNKIITTYEGVTNLSKNNNETTYEIESDKKTLFKYNISKPYLLYVGSAYPHKNLEGLLKVFKRILDSRLLEINNLQLILVGKDDYFYTRVKALAKNLGLLNISEGSSDVIFSGYVPDKDLKILYKYALAYVFPSFYEGFGLPPLEAIAENCPVVSSNKTSLPEILGDSALYFNPEDESDMYEKIIKIIGSEALRKELVIKGSDHIKKYNWRVCAVKTLEIYQTI